MQKDKDMVPDPGVTEADKALAMRYAFGSGADPDRDLVEEVCRKLDASGEEDAAAVASYCRWYIADMDGRYGDSMKHATDYISSPKADEGIKAQLLDYLDEKKKILAGMDEEDRYDYLKIKKPLKSEPPLRGKDHAVIRKVIIGIVILALLAAGLIIGLGACGDGDDIPSGTTVPGNENDNDYSEEHDEALGAYDDMLSSGGIEVQDGNFETENCSFAVAYIDDDDIPELLIYDREDNQHVTGYGALYRYSDGRVELVCTMNLNIEDGMEAGYFEGSGYFTDSYASTGYANVSINSIRNAGLRNDFNDAEDVSLGAGYAVDDPHGSETGYYIDDPENDQSGEISRDGFYDKLDEITGGCEYVEYEFHENTPDNRDEVFR